VISVPHLQLVPPAPPGDDELRLAALRAGDPAALEEVLHELLPNVRRWLARLLGPRDELDDAVQEALTQLALSLPSFAGRSSLATFAHRVTVRAAYRFFGRPTSVGLELAPPPEGPDPESRLAAREALRRLYRALDRLPPNRRVAFVLCAVEGMTPGEAAVVEGVSGEAMRSRLLHARDELGALLADDPYVAALAGRRRDA
jgi:RNA polymerase sigma factor (sigma-70 family)